MIRIGFLGLCCLFVFVGYAFGQSGQLYQNLMVIPDLQDATIVQQDATKSGDKEKLSSYLIAIEQEEVDPFYVQPWVYLITQQDATGQNVKKVQLLQRLFQEIKARFGAGMADFFFKLADFEEEKPKFWRTLWGQRYYEYVVCDPLQCEENLGHFLYDPVVKKLIARLKVGESVYYAKNLAAIEKQLLDDLYDDRLLKREAEKKRKMGETQDDQTATNSFQPSTNEQPQAL